MFDALFIYLYLFKTRTSIFGINIPIWISQQVYLILLLSAKAIKDLIILISISKFFLYQLCVLLSITYFLPIEIKILFFCIYTLEFYLILLLNMFSLHGAQKVVLVSIISRVTFKQVFASSWTTIIHLAHQRIHLRGFYICAIVFAGG